MKLSNSTKHAKKQAKLLKKKETAKSIAEALQKVKKGAVQVQKDKKSFSKSSTSKEKSSSGHKRKRDGESKPDKSEQKPIKRSKPHMKLVEDMKSSWNVVRIKNIPKSERDEVIAKMVTKLQGHLLQVSLRHDVSRAVQSVFQFGSAAQRLQILSEMKDKLFEFAKTPYGHFVILKAITYCVTLQEQTILASAFKGHFVSLGTNIIGSRTVESLLHTLPKKLTTPLKAEFYGHKFTVLCAAPPANLSALLTALPEKTAPILDHMRDLIQKLVEKNLTQFNYCHGLIYEYAVHAENVPTRVADLLSMLLSHIPNLITTKPGAKVVCLLVTHSNAKERKTIMKHFKGKMVEYLCHSSAYLPVMRLVQVTDDTVNVHKTLLDELRATSVPQQFTATGEAIITYPPLIAVSKHANGKKFLLQLLNCTKQYLEPDEKVLFDESNVTTSKKTFEARQLANLTYLQSSLLSVMQSYSSELMTCAHGSRVLEEVAVVFNAGGVLENIVNAFVGREAVAGDEAEVDEAQESDAEESGSEDNEPLEQEDEQMEEIENESDDESVDGSENDGEANSPAKQEFDGPIYEHPVAMKLLKNLLKYQSSLADGSITPVTAHWHEDTFDIAQRLLSALIDTETVAAWCTSNRSCFALVDMLLLLKQPVVDVLSPIRKDIDANSAGGKKLLEELDKLSKPEVKKRTTRRTKA